MSYSGKKFGSPTRSSLDSESVMSFDDVDEDEKDSVKRKTRNLSEKKRRDQFNVLIGELCAMVALNSKKLDKSSVLKNAIQFLKNHQEFAVQSAANEIKENWKPAFLSNEEFAQLMLEAVDSFLLVFNHRGKILFTSDSVTSLLGHLSADLVNHSLFNLMHQEDRPMFEQLLSRDHSATDNTISFNCHLKRGSIDPSENMTYEYVSVSGTTQYIGDGENPVTPPGDFLNDGEVSLCYCCTVRLQVRMLPGISFFVLFFAILIFFIIIRSTENCLMLWYQAGFFLKVDHSKFIEMVF